MRRATSSWVRTMWLSPLVILAGCVNKPGALRMSVSPTVVRHDPAQCVHLRVLFEAVNKPVAIERLSPFSVNLARAGNPLDDNLLATRVFCGGAGMSLVDLALAASLTATTKFLDVADLRERYFVIRPNHPASYDLVLSARESGYSANVTGDAEDIRQDRPIKCSWPAGQYAVTVSLRPPQDLAPAFWQPYSQPLSASADFRVGADPH